jgi:hypothetical protein
VQAPLSVALTRPLRGTLSALRLNFACLSWVRLGTSRLGRDCSSFRPRPWHSLCPSLSPPPPPPLPPTRTLPCLVDSFNHRVLEVDVLRGRLLGELPLQRQDGQRPKGIAATSAHIALSFTSAVHLLHAGTRATLWNFSTGDGAPGGLRFCADGEHLVVTEPQPGRLRLRSVADGSCCGLVPSEFDGQSMLDVEECASGWIVAAGMDTPVSLIPRTTASTGVGKHALFLVESSAVCAALTGLCGSPRPWIVLLLLLLLLLFLCLVLLPAVAAIAVVLALYWTPMLLLFLLLLLSQPDSMGFHCTLVHPYRC